MSDIEKIKFGEQVFDLVPNGVKLNDCGGSIIFRLGNADFYAVKSNLKLNGDITQISISGTPDWSRSDLVYDGKLTNLDNYEISTGVKEEVLIATFRLPDAREQIKDTNAIVDYLLMMSGISLEEFKL